MKDDYDRLILNVSKGDKKSLEILYDKLHSDVLKLCISRLKKYDIALDVTQETFLQIKLSAHRFVPQGNGKTWIMCIASNQIKNAQKLLTRERNYIRVDEMDGGFATDKMDIQAEIADRLLLKRALNSLPEKQYRVVIMRILGGISLVEIAKELGEPYGTISWRYKTAIDKLRWYLTLELHNNRNDTYS